LVRVRVPIHDVSISSILAPRYLGHNEADDGLEINYEAPKELVILILFETKDKELTTEVRSVSLNQKFV
jgi:hypothetical protein